MGDDLSTLAENKLEAAIAADEEAAAAANPDGGQDPPEGTDPKPKDNEEDGDDPLQDGGEQEGQDPAEGEEEEGAEGKKPEGDAGKPKEPEAPKPLTDDELIAELEKRGLKVEKTKEDDDAASQQPKPINRPEEIPEGVWGNMRPEQQHIYSNLNYITINGTQGEGDDAKQVTLRVKTPEQIPEDFVFANKRAESQFNSDIAAQSVKAERMYADLTSRTKQESERQASQAESKSVVDDVERLQTDNILPKIVAKPGTPEFNADPGVILANKILAYRGEQQAKGETISAYNAALAYKGLHPEEFEAPKPKVNPGDVERKKTSANVAGKNGGTPSTPNKGTRRVWPVGTSAADIADALSEDLD